jgi:hypothetical protein
VFLDILKALRAGTATGRKVEGKRQKWKKLPSFCLNLGLPPSRLGVLQSRLIAPGNTLRFFSKMNGARRRREGQRIMGNWYSFCRLVCHALALTA